MTRSAWRTICFRSIAMFAIGFVLSTAAAAACLLYAPTSPTADLGGISSDLAKGKQPDEIGYKKGQRYSGLGVEIWLDYWYKVSEPAPGVRNVHGAGISTLRCGWPFQAFASPEPSFPATASQAKFDSCVAAAYARPNTDTTFFRSIRAVPYRELPTHPLIAGIIGNAAVFGLAAAALVYGPARIRTAMRRRSGRCVHCGYPRDGAARCPECGIEGCAFAAKFRRFTGAAV